MFALEEHINEFVMFLLEDETDPNFKAMSIQATNTGTLCAQNSNMSLLRQTNTSLGFQTPFEDNKGMYCVCIDN